MRVIDIRLVHNRCAEAACNMLKSQDFVIPVVDADKKLLGLVTRTDVF